MVAFADPSPTNSDLLGVPIIPENEIEHSIPMIVAIGSNFARRSVMERFVTLRSIESFATLIHPSASIGRHVCIGAGSVILQNATIGVGARIGAGVIVNSGAILDHESEMGDFSSLAPGSTTGGQVSIGVETAISIGATVSHGVTIGQQCVVGGQSFVNDDLPDRSVAYGIPARNVRQRAENERYL